MFGEFAVKLGFGSLSVLFVLFQIFLEMKQKLLFVDVLIEKDKGLKACANCTDSLARFCLNELDL